MSHLDALIIFAKVAESHSFSGAARLLGTPLSTVSRKVADLENQLGVRLLERSTRRLRLTDIGAEVLEFAQRGVEVEEAVKSIVSHQSAELKGTIRLSTPPSISDSLIVPLVTAFQITHPAVVLQVMVADRFVDHIAEGIDIAFRAGKMRDSSLISRILLKYRHRLLASASYVEKFGAPTHPAELEDHRLLSFASLTTTENSWEFEKDGKQQSVLIRPCLEMNDYAGLAAAILSGAGIGELPPVISSSFLKDDQLVDIMPSWQFPVMELSIVYTSNRHMPRATRMFKDFTIKMMPDFFGDSRI